jgi:O-antigen ligase
MTSFLAVVALSHLITESSIYRKIIWFFVLSAAVFSITHLLTGRTGQVVCALALVSVVFIALPLRKALLIIFCLFALFLVLTFTSPLILQKFSLVISEIKAYQQGEQMTSVGARIAMWATSINFYSDQPIWGHGTGSYRWITEQVFNDSVMCRISCIHPHNQFLFFGVEHGLPGLVVYSWLLFSIARTATQVELRHKLILSGLLTIIFVDSFINSPFWISSERNFYTAVLALALSSFYLNQKSPIEPKGL